MNKARPSTEKREIDVTTDSMVEVRTRILFPEKKSEIWFVTEI